MKHVVKSIAFGLGRVAGSPKLVLGLWLVSVLAALPAAMVMGEILEESIGPSLFHQTLANGFDGDWYAEFDLENDGIAETFGPQILGIGAVYENLEAWWSGRLFEDFPLGLVSLGIAYALLWTLILGGILNSLAGREEQIGRSSQRFLAAGARTFSRFLQLALAAGVLYYLIYRLGRGLYSWIESSTEGVTVEKEIFFKVLVAAAFVVTLLHLVRMIFDYAKIAVFVEDLSAPRALWRGLTLVAARPFSTFGIYGGLGLLSLMVMVLYAALAPGAGQSSVLLVVLAFILSQVYLIARLAIRLGLLAAQLNFYRSLS